MPRPTCGLWISVFYKRHLEDLVWERASELERANRRLKVEVKERTDAEKHKEKLIGDLQKALSEIKMLTGLLPICTNCKKIRDDKGYWNQIETYIQSHTDARFSHGICPKCAEELYPDFNLPENER